MALGNVGLGAGDVELGVLGAGGVFVRVAVGASVGVGVTARQKIVHRFVDVIVREREDGQLIVTESPGARLTVESRALVGNTNNAAETATAIKTFFKCRYFKRYSYSR